MCDFLLYVVVHLLFVVRSGSRRDDRRHLVRVQRMSLCCEDLVVRGVEIGAIVLVSVDCLLVGQMVVLRCFRMPLRLNFARSQALVLCISLTPFKQTFYSPNNPSSTYPKVEAISPTISYPTLCIVSNSPTNSHESLIPQYPSLTKSSLSYGLVVQICFDLSFATVLLFRNHKIANVDVAKI